MHLKKSLLWTAGCLVGVLACSAAFAPRLSAAIKAAVVEIVVRESQPAEVVDVVRRVEVPSERSSRAVVC